MVGTAPENTVQEDKNDILQSEFQYSPAEYDTFPCIPKSYLDESYIRYTSPVDQIHVSCHPNGIAYLALASHHPIFTMQSSTQQLSLEVKPTSLSHVELKKGRGPVVVPGQRMLIIQTCGTDASEEKKTVFEICSPVRGLLVEFNSKLKGVDVLRSTDTGGAIKILRDEYIAILDLQQNEIDRLKHLGNGSLAVLQK